MTYNHGMGTGYSNLLYCILSKLCKLVKQLANDGFGDAHPLSSRKLSVIFSIRLKLGPGVIQRTEQENWDAAAEFNYVFSGPGFRVAGHSAFSLITAGSFVRAVAVRPSSQHHIQGSSPSHLCHLIHSFWNFRGLTGVWNNKSRGFSRQKRYLASGAQA